MSCVFPFTGPICSASSSSVAYHINQLAFETSSEVIPWDPKKIQRILGLTGTVSCSCTGWLASGVAGGPRCWTGSAVVLMCCVVGVMLLHFFGIPIRPTEAFFVEPHQMENLHTGAMAFGNSQGFVPSLWSISCKRSPKHVYL